MSCIIEKLNIDIDNGIYVPLEWYKDAMKVQEMLKYQKENAKIISNSLEIIDNSIKKICNSVNELKENNNKLVKLNKILISKYLYYNIIENKIDVQSKLEPCEIINSEIDRIKKEKKIYEVQLFKNCCKCICYW
jgi:hypothetical protein